MAFSVTTLGTSNAAASTTSVTGVAVPANATILVFANDVGGNPATGTVTDSAGNTYTNVSTQLNNNDGIGGRGQTFLAHDVSALTSGNSITFHGTGANAVGMSAVYVTGMLLGSTPLDSASVATAFSTGSPTVTSGTPSGSGYQFFAASFSFSSSSYSQAATWSSPPDADVSIAELICGTLLNAGSGTKTYAPGVGTSRKTSTHIFALKPPGSVPRPRKALLGAGL